MENINTDEFKIKLKQFVLNNKDGFTINFNLKPIEYKKGFCVSITNNSDTDLNQAIESLIKLSQQEPFKDIEPLFIGGWCDVKQDNLFYLDLTLYIKNRSIAEAIGKLFKQKAIFNLSNFESIYL